MLLKEECSKHNKGPCAVTHMITHPEECVCFIIWSWQMRHTFAIRNACHDVNNWSRSPGNTVPQVEQQKVEVGNDYTRWSLTSTPPQSTDRVSGVSSTPGVRCTSSLGGKIPVWPLRVLCIQQYRYLLPDRTVQPVLQRPPIGVEITPPRTAQVMVAFVCLFVCLFTCSFFRLFVCSFVCCLFVCLLACLLMCSFAHLLVCLFVLFLEICFLLFAFSLVSLNFSVVCFLLLSVVSNGVVQLMWCGMMRCGFCVCAGCCSIYCSAWFVCVCVCVCARARARVCVCVCVCVRSFCLLLFRFAAFSFCCFWLFVFVVVFFVFFAFCVFRPVPFYFVLWFVIAAVALPLSQSRAFASLFGFLFFIWCAVLWCVVRCGVLSFGMI